MKNGGVRQVINGSDSNDIPLKSWGKSERLLIDSAASDISVTPLLLSINKMMKGPSLVTTYFQEDRRGATMRLELVPGFIGGGADFDGGGFFWWIIQMCHTKALSSLQTVW